MTSIGPSGIESQAGVHFGEHPPDEDAGGDQVSMADVHAAREPQNAREELEAELAELVADNKQKLAQVTSHGAQIEPMGVFQLRMQVMADFLFPPGSAERTQFELAFESQMGTYLDQAVSDVRKQMLQQGVNQGAAEGLVFPGNRSGHHPGHKRR